MDLTIVYVTVGTTQFDALITAVTSESALGALQARNCKKLILQHGNSKPIESSELIYKEYGIQLEQYKFRPNIEDIRTANLIIGHAGAGTCMDILNNNKAGLIVVNDQLMDNHQLELAQQLAAEQYLYFCKVSALSNQLAELDFTKLKIYEPPRENMQKFVKAVNELMAKE